MGKRVQALFAVFVGLLFAAVLAASAAGAVSVGHSGWTWGDPSPQGNDLIAIEFSGNRGYAVGRFGTVLRTEDGGATWTGLSTGITQDLFRLRLIDSDSLVIAGQCLLRRSDDGGQTFSRLPWTASDQQCAKDIASVHFPSSEVGYLLLEDGTVLRTADGGQTWARKTAVPETVAFGGPWTPTDIFFTSLDTGVVTIKPGRIYRTLDGGNTWTPAYTDPATFRDLNTLLFIDASTGYAVGKDSIMQATTDGGVTWKLKFPQQDTLNVPIEFTSIHCANAMTCLMTTAAGDRLVRTTDGGDTGKSATFSTNLIHAAAFASATRAVAVGDSGTTFVSDDAGVTWSKLGSSLTDDFSRLRASSPSLAFAVGDGGALARTTDGGASWSSVSVSTSAKIVDTSFPSQSTGYVLDSGGSALRTDNGGASWKILDPGTTAMPRALVALDVERVLLIGPRGIRLSTDGGNSFGRVRGSSVSKANLTDYDRAGRAVFAFGFKALYVSTTAGQSWKKVRRPRTRADLQAVDFVSTRRGFALTLDGRIWRTANGGRRWREVPGIGTGDAFELAFSDTRNGFAAVRGFAGKFNGYVLRTEDGGKSWAPQLIDSKGIDNDGMVATGSKTAIVLSLGNSLFTTSTGGQAGSVTSLSLKTKARRLRRKTTIQVTGKLSPAEGGEQVIVSMRGARLNKWRQKTVTVAANGSFTTSWKVSATSYFVAQWSGDDTRAGDGSSVLTVKMKARRRR